MDNLWITMGFIHMPRKRVLRPATAFSGVMAILPYPRPRSARMARLRGIAGDPPDEENPMRDGATKNPGEIAGVRV